MHLLELFAQLCISSTSSVAGRMQSRSLLRRRPWLLCLRVVLCARRARRALAALVPFQTLLGPVNGPFDSQISAKYLNEI